MVQSIDSQMNARERKFSLPVTIILREHGFQGQEVVSSAKKSKNKWQELAAVFAIPHKP
jgi:cupin superfamily acireductone dioxygenase involved in methionine salvage